MANEVPEKLINFRVYRDKDNLLGVADVQLPSLEMMTTTIKGAGLAGEVDSPVIGHFGSMTISMNWRISTPGFTTLIKQESHSLDIRGAAQLYDAGSGKYRTMPVKVMVKAFPKKAELGKLDVGAAQESSWEGEVTYMKVWIDGKEKIEIDKYNYICTIDGDDHLAPVRKALNP